MTLHRIPLALGRWGLMALLAMQVSAWPAHADDEPPRPIFGRVLVPDVSVPAQTDASTPTRVDTAISPALKAPLMPASAMPADDETPRPVFGRILVADIPMTEPGESPLLLQIQDPDKAKKPALTPAPPPKIGTLFYTLPLTVPPKGALFRMESETAFRDRLKQEARDRGLQRQLEFPESTPVPHPREIPMRGPGYTMTVEPSYVISGTLMWEQRHFERYGVSLGVLQPGVSTGVFVFDTLMWPARRLTHPLTWNQVNADSYSPYFYLMERTHESVPPVWGLGTQ